VPVNAFQNVAELFWQVEARWLKRQDITWSVFLHEASNQVFVRFCFMFAVVTGNLGRVLQDFQVLLQYKKQVSPGKRSCTPPLEKPDHGVT